MRQQQDLSHLTSVIWPIFFSKPFQWDVCQHRICDSFLPYYFFKLRKHIEDELEKGLWSWMQIVALEFEPAMLNSCIAEEKRDTTQSASSCHKWTRSYTASFYFRILIWESRVSDSSSLGKAGVAPGFVVLSDTVFINNSQQGRPERGLKCHGKWCLMSNLIFSVSPHFDSWNEMRSADAQWRRLRVLSVFEKQVLLCESQISTLISHLSLVCLSHLMGGHVWHL